MFIFYVVVENIIQYALNIYNIYNVFRCDNIDEVIDHEE